MDAHHSQVRVSRKTGCIPGGHVVGGTGGSHVTTSRRVGTVPAGQVTVTGGAHGFAPHGPSTGAAGAAGSGVGATAGVGGGGVAGGFGAAGGFGGFGAAGGFGGGAAGGVGAATGARGVSFDADGVGAGWSAITASTGPRTSVGASIDTADMAGSDPVVGPTGFTEQAANPRLTPTTEIKCLNLIVSSPFLPPCGPGPPAGDGCTGFAAPQRLTSGLAFGRSSGLPATRSMRSAAR